MYYYKVKIVHADDKGSAVAETYIVKATSVLDAEAKVAASGLFDEYSVEAITKPRLSSVINGEGEKFYRCKSVVNITDKLTPIYDLVQADSFDEATARLKAMVGTEGVDIEFVLLTSIKGYIA